MARLRRLNEKRDLSFTFGDITRNQFDYEVTEFTDPGYL